MSFAIDVNILLYASNRDDPLQPKAEAFLADCASGNEVFCLAWLTVMSYLRMATHASIFSQPLTPAEALSNVEALLALPHARAIGEDDGFLRSFREVTQQVPARANGVPDAHLATVLRQHGIRKLYTHDRDFRRFDFLDAVDPLG
jgi:hypothetical protein